MKRVILCLLLFGLFLSSYRTPSHQIEVEEIVVEDTIPPLNKENLKKELIKRNIPHYKIVLAQSLHETGNFKSKLCRKKNNIFGLKGKKGYKKYKSWIECVDDYEQRFSKRYKGGDYFVFLKKYNYASDPLYEKRVKRFL